MTGVYETPALEVLLIDPNEPQPKDSANEGTQGLAQSLGATMSQDLTAEVGSFTPQYDVTEGGDKSGLHIIRYLFTGTPGAQLQIIHPLVQHLFLNDNTSTQILEHTIAGQPLTAPQVRPGEARLLYSDGINIIPFSHTETIPVSVGDDTTALTVGAAKYTFRMPYGFKLIEVRGSLVTASGAGTVDVDINDDGVSVFATILTFDAAEKTTATAATPAVIGNPDIDDDSEMTIDVDATDGTAAGLKLMLIGRRAAV